MAMFERSSTMSPPEEYPPAPRRWAIALVLGLAAFILYALYETKTSLPSGFSTSSHGITIHKDGDRVYLWASGAKDYEAIGSTWFDMTGTPLPVEQFQYGIGRDTIQSIDHPIFRKADDPDLRERWGRSKDADIGSLIVLGYAHNGEAHAYPLTLMNRHELVNDLVGGKPVTVGW